MSYYIEDSLIADWGIDWEIVDWGLEDYSTNADWGVMPGARDAPSKSSISE
jgi:hypothetical protein